MRATIISEVWDAFRFAGHYSVGRADGLISGIFLDDDISATGGFAENCALADCKHDMGLTNQDMQDLQDGWADMMNRTQARVLELGGFDWRECGYLSKNRVQLLSYTHLYYCESLL